MSKVSRNGNQVSQQAQAPTDQSRIRLDTITISHVESTKEEILLNVGLNQCGNWRQPDSQVQLTNRIILSSFVAKRLAMFFKRGTFNLPKE